MKHRLRLLSTWVPLLSCPAVLFLAPLARPSNAHAADENPFVTSGGEVLRDRLQIPWYDAETDAVRPIPIATRWEWDLAWLAEPIYWLLIVLLVALLVALAWFVLRMVRERQRRHAPTAGAKTDPLVLADRIEALPYLRERSQDDLLAQARRQYQEGNYSEAIIYLYSHELVELDRSATIRLAKGKTNRQYLREAARMRSMKGLLERTMVTFEDVFFGRRTLDRTGFEACWNQLSEFETLVTQAQAVP